MVEASGLPARSDSSTPRVTVVILNWNNAAETLECLNSVAALTYPNFETIVVDNGSTDGSAQRIEKAFPAIELLRLFRNLGYAQGNNEGIRLALSREAAYVFLLNNDTRVAPDVLIRLVEFLEPRPEVGMVGPTVYRMHPPDRLFAAGSTIDWKNGCTEHRGLNQLAEEEKALRKPEPVDFVSGCGVLVRRELIESCGALDPSFFLNFEDVEWAVRAWRYGFQVWHVPGARMWHKVSATLGQESTANVYYMTRNGLLFFWRNTPGWNRIRPVVWIVFRTLRTVAAWTIKRQYRAEIFRQKRQANLLALRDFFLARFGERFTPTRTKQGF